MTGSYAIQLDDGRIVIGTPGPEDQGLLGGRGDNEIVLITELEADTSGHGYPTDVTVDVEGHAMTLRLPSSADAEALRKALAIGAVTATLVAAGAISAMQGNPAAPAIPQTVVQPHTGPAPAADFQVRREQAVDKMLEAPAPLVQPVDEPIERLSHQVTPAAGAGSASAAGAAAAGAAAAQSTSFEERKEQQADKLLEAPPPISQPSDITTD